MSFLFEFHWAFRARVRTYSRMVLKVSFQLCRPSKSLVTLFASILARLLLVHDAFVHQHTAFHSETRLAPVHVAHKWLGKSVHHAVFLCLIVGAKSLVTFVASERPFVGVFAAVVSLQRAFACEFHRAFRARVRPFAGMDAAVYVHLIL